MIKQSIRQSALSVTCQRVHSRQQQSRIGESETAKRSGSAADLHAFSSYSTIFQRTFNEHSAEISSVSADFWHSFSRRSSADPDAAADSQHRSEQQHSRKADLLRCSSQDRASGTKAELPQAKIQIRFCLEDHQVKFWIYCQTIQSGSCTTDAGSETEDTQTQQRTRTLPEGLHSIWQKQNA